MVCFVGLWPFFGHTHLHYTSTMRFVCRHQWQSIGKGNHSWFLCWCCDLPRHLGTLAIYIHFHGIFFDNHGINCDATEPFEVIRAPYVFHVLCQFPNRFVSVVFGLLHLS